MLRWVLDLVSHNFFFLVLTKIWLSHCVHFNTVLFCFFSDAVDSALLLLFFGSNYKEVLCKQKHVTLGMVIGAQSGFW